MAFFEYPGAQRLLYAREVAMRKPSWTLLLVAALGLAACETPITAHHEYDKRARFNEFTEFAWVTNEPLIHPSPGLDPRLSPVIEKTIRAAIERNLIEKGYTRIAEARSADVVLSFSVGTREKIEVDSYPVLGGYRYGARGAWVSDVHSYTEGILAIDVFEVHSKQVVWHGWAAETLSPSADQEKREENINRVVDAILAEFPFRNTLR